MSSIFAFALLLFLNLQPYEAVEPHMNRATARLLAGDLAGGFAEYRWRWRAAGAITRRAKETTLEPEVAEALSAAARLHGVAPPPVRLSLEIRSPVVAGFRRDMDRAFPEQHRTSRR